MKKSSMILIPILLGGVLSFQNCSPAHFGPGAAQALDAGNAVTGNADTSSSSPPVCSPFSGSSGSASSTNGMTGTLTYIPTTSPVLNNSLNVGYFTSGSPDVVTVPNQLIMNQVDVETQDFSNGFTLSDGSYLEDNSGQKLVQYFGIQASGFIGLAAPGSSGVSKAGNYQFAVLADDGATFTATDSAGNQVSVNDDGTHSNKFVCSSSAAALSAGGPISFQLNYYQGPPVRLAFMLLWREVTDSNQGSVYNDPLCSKGAKNDDYYFSNNSGDQPVPTANYAALLAAGWQVVPAANFFLPIGVTNTCQ